MSLKFVFGPSGAGKSRQIYEEIIRRADQEPRKNFLVIVPDQFTMQTQKDLVLLSDRGGIMNIDVLSFGRLSHRILEEAGGVDTPILDDTGKSLVLQNIAAGFIEGGLPALGSFLSRQGYIHEVKSVISEFMQYGISVEDVDRLAGFAEKRGALAQKLRDLKVLYKGFQEYIQGNFIAAEETLDVLCRLLPKSELLPESVVVFDGFTGFTPIQGRVIRELMHLCGEVVVALAMGGEENPYVADGEQKLFHLSKKTVAGLEKLAGEAGTQRGRDVFVLPAGASVTKKWAGDLQGRCDIVFRERHRFEFSPALRHLERNLFRYSVAPFEEEQQEIHIFEAGTPRSEVRQAGLMIHGLVRGMGFAYRDIAVVAGDLAGYGPYVETEFAQMEIPFFLDQTRGIVLNPMAEYIKSALELYLKDFSYEAVFHYLRSGLADLERAEVDVLENYVLQTGIRGYGSYSRLFTRRMGSLSEEELCRLNGIRERFLAQTAALHAFHAKEQQPAAYYVDALYDFLVQDGVQGKLSAYESEFTRQGQLSRAREYAQIYRLIMELLEQIYDILGDEVISLREFADILEAGFGEIRVGAIPQNVDRVVVGDMERTRLKQVKALFFLGVNDGNIPKSASRGGIISDMDREFLRESDLELAPSPRQQMFIQRLYLYLNMTKPSRHLYLGYSRVNSAGKSMRPAYLIDTVKKLFPAIATQYPELRSPLEQIVTGKEGAGYLAEGLREYAAGVLAPEREREVFAIYQAFGGAGLSDERAFLRGAAFYRYRGNELSRAAARALYGPKEVAYSPSLEVAIGPSLEVAYSPLKEEGLRPLLESSVSRLETFAACAYRHFLQYGLALAERREFAFEQVDRGNIYHGVLELFAEKLRESRYTWFDFPAEFAAEAVREALEFYAASYGSAVLYSSARNAYAIVRMGRILTRTVLTMQRQLKKGSFRPDAHEFPFQKKWISLSEQETMRLRGRIDRIDVAEDGDQVYVKVVDYKSGDRRFDLTALYYGLQLQLAVYMNAALEEEAKRHPGKETVPAAMLYYHINDPMVESAVELSGEEIEEQIAGQLRMRGLVNADPGIVERLDAGDWSRSDVIPVERKKDGAFGARSSVLDGADFKSVSDYVSKKAAEIGSQILDGQISFNPYALGNEEACTWCAFKRVCGFEPSLPGCEGRKLKSMESGEAMERIREALGSQA